MFLVFSSSFCYSIQGLCFLDMASASHGVGFCIYIGRYHLVVFLMNFFFIILEIRSLVRDRRHCRHNSDAVDTTTQASTRCAVFFLICIPFLVLDS